MNSVKAFTGVIPPVSTIFNEEGLVDQQQMGWLIDFLIKKGVNGLFFLGTGGEFSQMSTDERKEIAEFAVSYVNGRVPVLIGTGSTNTREAIDLSIHAQRIGADGVVVVNPYYWTLSEEHLLGYFGDIAKATNLPIILYNFPNLTGQDLTADLVLELVDNHANIVGIKDTVDSVGHIRDMILKVKGKHPHFSVMCGFDDHLLNTLQLGGDGVISASGNFAPNLSVGIYNSFLAGDLKEASKLYKQLAILPSLYKIDSPFVNVVKEAMKLCGMDVSTHVLPPTKPLSKEKKAKVKEILELAKILPSTPNKV
ncbi:dihydrodipicolinate synthase family protein [Halalkalibacter okhensis]|uniref:2-keto-3-deoxy-galactonate aldolase n=1 Tax=Halalkalibacter okhensis TaxID=333138 RepID=A0A0B0IEW1_9BACI|nr:dihydrodipicolinate synthase family protein [Halalkalibacter okhensis]KHF39367.1 2-keto-3-deoxy-galactonate aldolase [Halalkalibacter okhensis]